MENQSLSNHLDLWSDLHGKVVLVTGASSGLGREFCLDLAKAGCKVIAAARRTEHLKSLCEEINSTTPNANAVAAAVELDVTAEAQVIKDSVEKAWNVFGSIHTLINNAGITGRPATSLDLPEEEWDKIIRTNLRGSWLVSKYVGTYMRCTSKGGSIINISSISGLNRGTFVGGVAYSSSKAALDNMTKVMALELAKYKIRVNSIAPGLFESEITKDLIAQEWQKNVIARIVPLKTYGTTDPALTSLIRYLIHDSSQYISGNIFIVDSGITLPGSPIFSSL